jgi:hypothetical protein
VRRPSWLSGPCSHERLIAISKRLVLLIVANAGALGLTVCVFLVFAPHAARADFVVAACTEAGLDAALAVGGNVSFACGPGDHVITLTAMKAVTRNVSIDGADVITFSGGGTTGLFSVTRGVTFELNELTLRDGNNTGSLFDPLCWLPLSSARFVGRKWPMRPSGSGEATRSTPGTP